LDFFYHANHDSLLTLLSTSIIPWLGIDINIAFDYRTFL